MNIQNEEKVVRYVERFQSVIASDGFAGFFHADAGDNTQATLNALLIIEAIDAAALLRRAMWMFEGGAPPREQIARREALRQIGETERSVLRQLDERFSRSNDELTRSLARYSQSLEERYYVAWKEDKWAFLAPNTNAHGQHTRRRGYISDF
ncbi:MAG: DMP19 family protein [Pyrinomonadaceae bacterium]